MIRTNEKPPLHFPRLPLIVYYQFEGIAFGISLGFLEKKNRKREEERERWREGREIGSRDYRG